jgi:hypothetical protein
VPFKIELEDVGATVSTGFTSTTSLEQTRAVHELLVGRLQTALTRSYVPESAIKQAEEIIRRSKESNPSTADILTPPS